MSIGLAGPAGAGKNAVGDILTALYGFRQASFADALRKEVQEALLLDHPPPDAPPFIWDLVRQCVDAGIANVYEKPTQPLLRTLLQAWGTEYRRAADSDYWTSRVSRGSQYAYTDVRFPNEMTIPDELWYVWRPEAEAARGEHISEQQIKPTDCHRLIFNDRGLAHLRYQVVQVMAGIEPVFNCRVRPAAQ